MGAVFFLRPPAVQAAAANLITNPSMETPKPADATQPKGWKTDAWGTNQAVFAYRSTGAQSGTRSIRTTIKTYTDGDAKWYFDPVAVQPNHQYAYSEYFKSSVRTELLVQFTDANGDSTFQWLKGAAVNADWKQLSVTITTPSNAKKMTLLHIVDGVGFVEQDNVSLTDTTVAPTVSITAPAANATVKGTVTTTATANDAIGLRGIQFAVDNTPLGSEDTTAPYQATWDTTTLANGKHTLTATATGLSGLAKAKTISVTINNPVIPPAGQNIVPNNSVEQVASGQPKGWSTSHSKTNTPTFTYPNTGHTGSRSVRVDISQYTNGDAYWTYGSQPASGGKTYEFSDYYKSNAATEVYAHITMQDGSEQWDWIGAAPQSPGWSKFYEQYTMPAGAASVEVYHSLISTGFLVTDDYKLNEYKPVALSRPLVTLTFDDALRSTYDNGLPLLQQYHFTSTDYFLTGYTNDPQYMTVDMMKAFRDAGHEIGSHTVTHPSLPGLSPTDLNYELTQSKADLLSWLGTAPTAFASPHGEYNSDTIAAIKNVYASHRSVNVGFNSKDNFDKYDIKVQNIVSTTTTAQVTAWVNQAKTEHTWLVLVYHAVDPTSTDLWNTPPADLDQHFSAIQASGVPVVTIGQALTEITPQL
jgi:peptidoglycan/xylan/chitin deacetylase (PgdA/CDA1 family)